MDFGGILRTLLEERDLTQKQLATDLSIAPSTIGGYVQNRVEPDFNTLKQLAKYFDTSIDYLLDYQSGYTTTHEEDEILRIFRSLTEAQRVIFTAQGRVIVQHNSKGNRIDEIGFEIGLDNLKK